MPDASDFLNTAQSAELLDVDRSTLNRWAASGRLQPSVKIPGRTGARLFLRSEVLALRAELRAEKRRKEKATRRERRTKAAS